MTRPSRTRGSGHESRRMGARKRAQSPLQAPSGSVRSWNFDGGVLLGASGLFGMGVVMSYSATAPLALDHAIPPLFVEHLAALGLGCVVALVAAFTPLNRIRALALPAWALSVLLLAATDIFGVEVNGAQRWLPVPLLGIRFQPVEIAKLTSLLAVVAVVTNSPGRHGLPASRGAVAIGIVLVPVTFLVRQPDFGNAVLLCVLTATLLVAAGTPLRQLIAPALITVTAATSYIATHEYAMRRVVGFIDPWQDPQGKGFQLVQSFVAFGKGGVFGTGLGGGRQKLSYLPEGHTDFILALVAEELGLFGVLWVLAFFAALWVAGTRIARHSKDRFALLTALAMTAALTLPAAVNAAVVMGLLPTKGLTLPFLSHGGTSLIMSCATLGVLLSVGRSLAQPKSPRSSR